MVSLGSQFTINASSASAVKKVDKLISRIGVLSASIKSIPSSNIKNIVSSGAISDVSRLTNTMDVLSSKTDKLESQFNKISEASNTLGTSSKKISSGFKTASRDTDTFSSKIGNLRSNIVAFAGGELIAQAILGIGRSAFQTAQQLIAFESTMTAITGSSAGAADSLQFVMTTADDLGLSFVGLLDGYKKFVSASTLAGVSSDTARSAFTKMSGVLTVLKATSDQTRRAFLALEQIFSKGVVSTEELRRQLGEVIPGAFEIFAQSMGVSSKQLSILLRQGQVGIESVVPFIDKLSDKFKNGLATAINTPIANMRRLGNEAVKLGSAIGLVSFETFNVGQKALVESLQASENLVNSFEFIGAVVGSVFGLAATSVASFVLVAQGLTLPFTLLENSLKTVGFLLSSLKKGFFGDEEIGVAEALSNAVSSISKGLTEIAESLGLVDNAGSLTVLGSALAGISDTIGQLIAFGLSLTVLKWVGSFTIFTSTLQSARAATIVFGGVAVQAFTAVRAALVSSVSALALIRTGFAGLAGIFAGLNPVVLALVGSIAALGFALDRFGAFDNVFTNKQTQALKQLDLAYKSGTVSLETYLKVLKQLNRETSGFSLPKFSESDLGDFASQIEPVKTLSKELASNLGITGGAATALESNLTSMFVAIEDGGDVLDRFIQRLEKQEELNKRLLNTVTSRINSLANESASLDKNSSAFKQNESQIRKLLTIQSQLASNQSNLATRLDLAKNSVSNFSDAFVELNDKGSNVILNVTTNVGEERDKVVSFGESITSLTGSISGVGQEAIKAAVELNKIFDVSEFANISSSMVSASEAVSNVANEASNLSSNFDTAGQTAVGVSSKIQDIINLDIPDKTFNITANVQTTGDTDALNTDIDPGSFAGGGIPTGGPPTPSGMNVPSFASGTRNTNSFMHNISGNNPDNGFLASLHANEAVVNLDNSGNIPVTVSRKSGSDQVDESNKLAPTVIANITIQAQDVNSFNRSRNQISKEVSDTISRSVRRLRP